MEAKIRFWERKKKSLFRPFLLFLCQNLYIFFSGDQDADGGGPDLRHLLDAVADIHDSHAHPPSDQ